MVVRRRVHEYEIEVEKKKGKVYHRCVEGTKGKTRSLEVPVSHETVRLSQGQKQAA